MFVTGDDTRATAAISKLVGGLGFAPPVLGKLHALCSLLDKGSALVLQNLVKQA